MTKMTNAIANAQIYEYKVSCILFSFLLGFAPKSGMGVVVGRLDGGEFNGVNVGISGGSLVGSNVVI